MYRLNVSITGIEAGTGVRYFPSWMEVSVTMMIVAIGFAVFGLAAKHLPIFETQAAQQQKRLRRLWLVKPSAPAGGLASTPSSGD